jgi:hypothetical protein
MLRLSGSRLPRNVRLAPCRGRIFVIASSSDLLASYPARSRSLSTTPDYVLLWADTQLSGHRVGTRVVDLSAGQWRPTNLDIVVISPVAGAPDNIGLVARQSAFWAPLRVAQRRPEAVQPSHGARKPLHLYRRPSILIRLQMISPLICRTKRLLQGNRTLA